ncbi:MAG TPA: YciI family protein, partial [Nitrospirales bacterium]|nr:YciI family protein [Nitrospirales bacterium]
MRFMIIVKSNGPGECEGDKMDPQFMEAMNRYNEELSKAGVLIDLRRLQPDSKGARVRFANGKPTVVDGPFAETKELVGGYWIWNVRSKQEAIDWVRRCPIMSRPNDVEIEVREI